jgi:effector-binding domain-containing protein
MKSIVIKLTALIDSSKILELADHYLKTAYDFLEHDEFELRFDTIITQMYEEDIKIGGEFYELIREIENKMKVPTESYCLLVTFLMRILLIYLTEKWYQTMFLIAAGLKNLRWS